MAKWLYCAVGVGEEGNLTEGSKTVVFRTPERHGYTMFEAEPQVRRYLEQRKLSLDKWFTYQIDALAFDTHPERYLIVE